jgi:hypothetical protein
MFSEIALKKVTMAYSGYFQVRQYINHLVSLDATVGTESLNNLRDPTVGELLTWTELSCYTISTSGAIGFPSAVISSETCITYNMFLT